jgi:hypothetical protein
MFFDEPRCLRNVQERGGIARVMGRLKIWKIMYNPDADDEKFYDQDEEKKVFVRKAQDLVAWFHAWGAKRGQAGLYSAQEYILNSNKFSKSDVCEEVVRSWGGLRGYKTKRVIKNGETTDPEKEVTEIVSDGRFAPSP